MSSISLVSANHKAFLQAIDKQMPGAVSDYLGMEVDHFSSSITEHKGLAAAQRRADKAGHLQCAKVKHPPGTPGAPGDPRHSPLIGLSGKSMHL
eukprot:gene33947-52934_t